MKCQRLQFLSTTRGPKSALCGMQEFFPTKPPRELIKSHWKAEFDPKTHHIHTHTHTHRAQPCKTCGKCSDLAPVSVSGAKLCQSENLPNTFPACVCHRQVSFCKADTKSSSTACTHTCCSLECFMKEGALHSAWKGNTGIPDPFNFKATCCNVKNWMENQFIETTTKKRKFGTWKWNTQTKHLSDCLTSPFQDVEEQ